MKIYFVTTSEFKARELRTFLNLEPSPVEVEIFLKYTQEVLAADIDTIVRNKALEAYKYLAVPCVVEHSGLFMEELKGLLPGGLGQIIWNAIGDRMCEFLREGDSRLATAESIIGYCDGRRVKLYKGQTKGEIAKGSRGNYTFNWDPIFIPEGSNQTYGEMGPEKKSLTSPTVKAWKAFLEDYSKDHKLDNKRRGTG
jgi:XTP/dITP diphosphohydrolase